MHTITIAAFATPETISAAALNACKSAGRVFAQSRRSFCVSPLDAAHIPYADMDALYSEAANSNAPNAAIAAQLLLSAKTADTVYALPGRCPPALLSLLKEKAPPDVFIKVLAGVPFGEAALHCAGCAYETYTNCYASALPQNVDVSLPLVIEGLDDTLRAGEVKVRLLEYYDGAHMVTLCTMHNDGAYAMAKLPLSALDKQPLFAAASVLIVPPAKLISLSRFGFNELVAVTRKLRAPGGCPWDREQTHESLKKAMIEECYEVLDAIGRQDDAGLCEELGDVLLQCVFHAGIAAEKARFTIRDVTTAIVKKLIFRHPHVFGTARADTAGDVLVKWEEQKKKEKQYISHTQVLKLVPGNLPALMRAYKVQKKAGLVGFDWDDPKDALTKLREETDELLFAMDGCGDTGEEMGDLLFSCVNVARLLGLDPEELLGYACEKFIARFEKMEALAAQKGLKLGNMPPNEQNLLWNAIKSAENGQN
ncbi:MAG: nucleoside triphosphate pyrophosphohydrolase [Clostridiales bacterium]|jgi:tetrapyrrole methylase family protein/MazG family protein|nr:nucleoside triphosphate pyrophosphohydrolase [Clostridiales bacterium]